MNRANYICIAILLCGSFACTAVDVEVVFERESESPPDVVRPKAPIDPKELPNAPVISGGPNPGFQACPAQANGINRNAVATPQHTDVWCWAASAEMVMRAHGTNVDQCGIVNRVQNGHLTVAEKPWCCGENGNIPVQCHTNGWPDQAFDAHGFNWDITNGALSKEKLMGQLCNVGPIIYVLLYPNGGGHSIVVKDYQKIDGEIDEEIDEELVLWIHDHRWVGGTHPRKATEIYPITYEEFRDGWWQERRYKHELDYVRIRPIPVSQ